MHGKTSALIFFVFTEFQNKKIVLSIKNDAITWVQTKQSLSNRQRNVWKTVCVWISRIIAEWHQLPAIDLSLTDESLVQIALACQLNHWQTAAAAPVLIARANYAKSIGHSPRIAWELSTTGPFISVALGRQTYIHCEEEKWQIIRERDWKERTFTYNQYKRVRIRCDQITCNEIALTSTTKLVRQLYDVLRKKKNKLSIDDCRTFTRSCNRESVHGKNDFAERSKILAAEYRSEN